MSLAEHHMLELPVVAYISFDLTCPDCGHKFQETLQRIQNSPTVNCPRCGVDIDVKFNTHGIGNTTKFGELRVSQSARGSITVSLEVYHEGLHKHRLIRGPDGDVVKAKAFLQADEWNEAWAKKVAADQHDDD